MVLTFYNCSSPTNKVVKTKTKVFETTINPNGPINTIDPVFTIELDGRSLDALTNANYVDAGAPLNRSYFIISQDFTIAKTAIIVCHVDVLSTYAARLSSNTLNYIRGAGSLTEMEDSSYPISDYMVEQYFPMTTWTDIFSADGDKRQYLLRTVCSDADTPNYVNLNNGNVFWATPFKNVYENAEDPSSPTIYYQCYQFNSAIHKDYYPEYFPRQDIQGLSQVNDGDYVLADGHAWQWEAVSKEEGAYRGRFIYKGATT